MSKKESTAVQAVENAEQEIKEGEKADAQNALELAEEVVAAAREEAEAKGDEVLLDRISALETRIDELTILVSKMVPDETEVIDVPPTTVPAPVVETAQENNDAPTDKADSVRAKRYFV